MKDLQLLVHGRGNAWPVPLGETHPFYDRTNPRDLSNAAFSLVAGNGDNRSEILVDAGHGTIQSLISGSNRIPDCICLTHGHMDHTLSVDWVVQSYWRLHERKKKYPLYSTTPVFEFLIQSYPHLEELIDFRELVPGVSRSIGRFGTFEVTSYPVYHGKSAVGASMLLIENDGRRILFTGDILTPLVGKRDLTNLSGIDLLVADTNNRFPWPRTNHWSFAGDHKDPMERNSVIGGFLESLDWETISGPHNPVKASPQSRKYFRRFREELSVKDLPFTILEFLKYIAPKKAMLVHYSGMEDQKYYNKPVMSADQLHLWANRTVESAGISSEIIIPETGATYDL